MHGKPVTRIRAIVLGAAFAAPVFCAAGTITIDSALREVQVSYQPAGSASWTTVGPTSTALGTFSETAVVNETYSDGSSIHADATQTSSIANTGTLLQVTASGSTNIGKSGSPPGVNTTSDLYVDFTIDDTFYYYYSVATTDMGWLTREVPFTWIRQGSGTFSGTLVAGQYSFDIGAWTTGGPHNEYAGTFIVSANPISVPAPIPATLALLGIGLAGLGIAKRRTGR